MGGTMIGIARGVLGSGRRSACWSVLLLLVVVGVQPAAATPLGQITEYGTSSGFAAGGNPRGITPGPDGNLWFADDGTSPMIGRVNPPTGQITEFPLPAGAHPYSIAIGADSNMWFTDNNTTAPAIGRINPYTGQIVEFGTSFGLNSGSSPRGITPGWDGNLWFADAGTTKAIGRINPSTGHIDEFPTCSACTAGAMITAGADGNVWFTDQQAPAAVGRVTPAGAIEEHTVPSGVIPTWIAPGSDGNVWFTSGAPFVGGTAEIGRIDPSTFLSTGTVSEFPTGAGSHPIQIVPGADGNMWFTDHESPSAIRQITTSGTLINSFSGGFSDAVWIAPGSDGNLWFGDRGATKAIGRVGSGAPAALQFAPSVSGSGRAGEPQTCKDAQWSTWAGEAPSLSLLHTNGTLWLRDGVPVGAGQTYTPPAGDTGHQLTCQQNATYPEPLLVTTSPATSGSVTVGAPQVTAFTISPKKFSLAGRRVNGKCVKPAAKNAGHPSCRRPVKLNVRFTLGTASAVRFTLSRKDPGRAVGGRCVKPTGKNAKHKKCTRLVKIEAVTHNGTAGANSFTLTIRGKGLRSGSYELSASANPNGSAGPAQTVKLVS